MKSKFIITLMTTTIVWSSLFAQNGSEFVLNFQNRKVDIAPFFDEFPYSQFSMSKDGTKLFYQNAGTETHLQWINLDGKSKLEDGKTAIQGDLSKKNCWRPKYNAADGYMYWIGDEQNEEIINIYRSSLTHPDAPQRLTNVPYIYAWDFNPDHTKIAYVGRMGQNEARVDELHILDLKTMKDELVNTDQADYRYTWGNISWKPDGNGLMLVALKDADRRFTNMVYIDTKTKKRFILTDPSKSGSYAGTDIMDDWLSDHECFFYSDQDGYRNLYYFNSDTKEIKQMTHFKSDLEDARLLTINRKKYLFGIMSTPVETTMVLMDPKDCSILYKQTSDMSYSIGAVEGNRVRVIGGNVTTLVQVQEIVVGKKDMKISTVFDLPESVKAELVQSNVERLSIPTFDIDPATNKTRMLHAYLFKPKNPLPAGKGMVMLESFYGGDNRYINEYQIYNKAGIYVLSASPRGSAGFGREFAAMNDGDLGGNEILDIISCAKYISQRLNIPANHIGCFGVSHGGYATMRLMTFPGEVNGHKASFPFGFGIETAGFCDIIYQHYHSNIPDWTFLEAGDPVANKAKLIDRSPLYHAEQLTGPLLLCHGNHDNRVDIEGSRLMDRKLTQLGLPHKYVEFEGLGHGIKGKANSLRFYSEVFSFLNKIEDNQSIK